MARRDELDRRLRDEHTALARLLRLVAPALGRPYSRSRLKRALDVAVVLPLVLVTAPLVALLAGVNRLLYPEFPAFYRQVRVGRRGPLPVLKLRTMIEFRHTPLGRILRRYYLDELPQLAQVLEGDLSAVGIRVLPEEIVRELGEEWSPERYARWWATYRDTPLGLTGLHQVTRRRGKEDARRYHRDMFYARHASLAFDLYLLWRTLFARGA
ncbi:MAG TPA: sugar transferase [Chloroflexota bacterium]|nr:sugar transferase [Chloroflexota bacterium]